VDLKYVLSTQIVQIQYEGKAYIFSVATVSTSTRNAGETKSDISESFGALNMNDTARLFLVDWDTAVAIEDDVQPESKPLSVKDFSFLHLLLYLTTWFSSTLVFQTNSKAPMRTQPSEG
jgi:hypothetical protein